jgi:uncharacterized membrane protein
MVVGMFKFGLDYILFPAFAGFMVVGPILAVGLYEKPSHRRWRTCRTEGHDFRKAKIRRTDSLHGRVAVPADAVWMRAAVIIYALFFGLQPFPGLDKSSPCCSPRQRDGQC